MTNDTILGASVYLNGDSVPINTNLTVEQVALNVVDATDMAQGGPAFVRLPCPGRPDALVRVDAIAALLPYMAPEDDDE